MKRESCNECGYPAEYHHTPPSKFKTCDLDFRCFPKSEWENVRKEVAYRKAEKELETLRARCNRLEALVREAIPEVADGGSGISSDWLQRAKAELEGK